MTRLWVCLLLFPALLPAQLSLAVGTPDNPVPGETLRVNDTLTTEVTATALFLKNSGTLPIFVNSLSIAGAAFSLRDLPALPRQLTAGESLAFTLSFAPTQTASYSATLNAGGLKIVVLGNGLAGASLFTGNPLALLQTGGTVDFGSAPSNSVVTRSFELRNDGTQTVDTAVAVTGAFQLVQDAPTRLNPGAVAVFTVQMNTAAPGNLTGVLALNSRRFGLSGVVLALSPPEASVSLVEAALQSGLQSSLRVLFAAPATVSGTGTVELISSASDTAVLFPSTGTNTATFSFQPGDSAGKFSGLGALLFQTGTVAGDIIFRLRIGGSAVTRIITIPAAKIGIDSVKTVRMSSSLEVQVNGFDNTLATPQVRFTFFDAQGATLSPGAISVNTQSAFSAYYASSHAGGMFSLKAIFPVLGGTDRVDSVQVEMMNSVGNTQAPRAKF